MNSKWYFSALFLLFTYLGVFHEGVTVPNQEIVLEFVDTKIDKKNVDNTIINIKEKLLKVGVSNIKIQKTKKGALKISYFSNLDVEIIKESLSNKKQLLLNKSQKKRKQKNNKHNYNLNVYEIVDDFDSSNLNDKFTFEFKHISDRFKTNYIYASIKHIDAFNENKLYNTAFKALKSNCLIKDYTSYNKPEVRAGPSTITSKICYSLHIS